MKKSKRIYIVLILLALYNAMTFANNDKTTTIEHTDTTRRISLLTCQPGDEVYSLYGHTAIRYQDTEQNIDIAINYGMFSFNKPYFILRFIFGLTDYEMGIIPFDIFLHEYNYYQRGIFEQELNLSPEEKDIFIKAIANNYLPENRTYRYNYLYDNCTTRARDIIIKCFRHNRQIKFTENKCEERNKSYRDFIHLYNEDYPWARFGNNLLLGLRADLPISDKQKQFLPENLKNDFENAKIVNRNTKQTQALVKTSGWITGPFNKDTGSGFIPRPIYFAWALMIISVISAIIELKNQRTMWGLDLFFMLATGLTGVIIFMMLFSQHPTTTINLQILLLNPISLLFAYRTTKKSKRMQKDRFWIYASVCILLFLAGSTIQCYAEGMCILAIALLVRCLSHIYRTYRLYET